MHKIFVRKIKKGGKEKLEAWGKELMGERKEEALESLRQENVQQERTWIVEIQGEKYFIAYMESQDKNILEMNKDMQINKDHVNVLKECLEWPLPISDLYDIALDK